MARGSVGLSLRREIPVWRVNPEDQGSTGAAARAVAKSADVRGNANGATSLAELWGGVDQVPNTLDGVTADDKRMAHEGISEAQRRSVASDVARVIQGKLMRWVSSLF